MQWRSGWTVAACVQQVRWLMDEEQLVVGGECAECSSLVVLMVKEKLRSSLRSVAALRYGRAG